MECVNLETKKVSMQLRFIETFREIKPKNVDVGNIEPWQFKMKFNFP